MEEHFITLILEDESEIECRILTIFEAAGRDYVALLPVDAPEGTAARPTVPSSRVTSTSTVGLPRESNISRAFTSTISK